MADVNNLPEPTFPTKRISDVTALDPSIEPKKQKLETLESNFTNNKVENTPEIEHPNTEIQKGKQVIVEEEAKQQESNEEEVKEKEELNGKAEIDRKGKGILIEEDEEEEEEDDDDDDDSDDSDDDDDDDGDNAVVDELSDDDFVDDPLAEVDLDNILPSRTRRKTINPGSYLATDIPEEDDDDESDDPDA